MISNWKTSKIKDFAEVKGGKRLPKGKSLSEIPNKHPYIRIKDLGKSRILEVTPEYGYVDNETQHQISHYIVNEGDILISVVGTIGLIGIVGQSLDKANLTENCDKIINLKGVDRDYLYYYLISPMGQNEINKNTVGAVQPKLPLKNIMDINVVYPDIDIQIKIAKVLSTLDKKIETNNLINQNLEQQVSAIYQAWFEEFIPYEGHCPNNWKYVSLRDITQITSGRRPPVKSSVKIDNFTVPLVGATSTMGYTNEANYNKKVLVIGRVGTLGVVQRYNTPFWASDNTLVISTPYFEFTDQILKRIDYSSINRGSTQPLITQGDMKKQLVLLPDEETISKFENIAGGLMSQYEANENESAILSDIRDALLPRLMSGELDVSSFDI